MAQIFYNEKIYGIIETDVNNYIIQSEMKEHKLETYMKKKNIIFIGMPAVGKSTVGVVVAKRLGKQFIDTDLLIQEQEKKLLREIIAEVGEDGFLKIENQVNRDVDVENAVISPGGSIV